MHIDSSSTWVFPEGQGRRVVFVVTRGDSIGGAQIHVRDLAFALKLRGWNPLVCLGSSGDLTHQLDAKGIRWKLIPGLVRSINPLADVRAIVALWQTIREEKPYVVSTHTAKSGLTGRIASWLAGSPALFTAHGWQFAEGISLAQKMVVLASERLCSAFSRKIITVSSYDFDLALSYGVAGKGRLRLVHNGMPDRQAPQRPRISNASEAVRLVMVARFQPQKDHPALFEALAGLQDRNWALTLVGDGPDTEAVRNLSRRLGVESRIDFAGQRQDVPDILDASDVFVLASNWEGFPRSILEGMRAALPVIASDVGGVRESVVDGETGLVVPRGDVAALQAALARLLDRPDERLSMGLAGRASFDAHFTFGAMCRKTWNVWVEAAKR